MSTAATTRESNRVAVELSGRCSGEPIPTTGCPTCGGRAWRLRATLAADGYWLWVCAACATKRLGDVADTWPADLPSTMSDDEDLDAAAAATMEGLFGGQDEP